MAYLLSFDAGTTSVRALLFDEQGRTLGICQEPLQQSYPNAGWVEEDPDEIWNLQLSTARRLLEQLSLQPDDITCLGITNQRETLIAWDKRTNRPIYPAIVWQCRRTEPICEQLKERGLYDWIHQKTGLLPDAYFSATKAQWILQNVPGARALAASGDLLFGTVDTWLIYQATKGRVYATDYTNASRTMLFNIHTLDWDDELLELFGLSRANLPQVYESGADFGALDGSYFAEGSASIPIRAVLGDQQSALFGQLCFEKAQAKCTYGTGAFILSNTGTEPLLSDNGLLTTVAWGLNGQVNYALEGSIFMAGAVVQWLRDNLGILKDAAQSQEIAESVPDSDGVYFISSFQGLGAPWWENGRRATISGMTRKTTAAHIVRAALESVAYRVKDVVDTMERAMGLPCTVLRVDGGMSANDFLMQFQSDLLQLPVMRAASAESTALGAACMAGLLCGVWENTEALVQSLTASAAPGSLYPQMQPDTAASLYDGWLRAIGQKP